MGDASKGLGEKEIESFSESTGFSREQVVKLYDYFQKIASIIKNDGVIDTAEFERAWGMEGSEFGKRLFSVLDKDSNGSLDFEEFITGIAIYTSTDRFEEKAKFAFDIYDLNEDGFIDRSELMFLLMACLREEYLVELSKEDLEEIVNETFREVDTDGNGEIDFEEFLNYAKLQPELVDNLEIKLPF